MITVVKKRYRNSESATDLSVWLCEYEVWVSRARGNHVATDLPERHQGLLSCAGAVIEIVSFRPPSYSKVRVKGTWSPVLTCCLRPISIT